MSTNTTFQQMLNEYLPNELLKEELVKRDYILSNIEKMDDWKGGNLVVPFKAAGASSVAYGGLSASNDIGEDKYVRGGVGAYKEVWGSMIFNHRDLLEHNTLSEQNFLKILPDAVDDFMDYLKGVVSSNLINGAFFAQCATATSVTTGIVNVNRPERFVIGQKSIIVDASNGTSLIGYCSNIDINNALVTFVTVRGGSTPLSFAAAPLTLNAKFYSDGAQTVGNPFSSLRGTLLPAALGGDANLYGQSKLAYPYLQAIAVSGASVTPTNVMAQIFAALTTIRNRGKGNPTEVIMSYRMLGYCMAIIENSKGAYNLIPGTQKASQYAWMEIEVGSVKGGLKLVGVQECDDDIIIFMDWRALKFHSNGFFQKRQSPSGNEYFEVRNQTGYQYILDILLFGEMVVSRPSYCGIMYGITA